MTTLVDAVSFTAGSGGTGSFVFSKARDSFRTPAQAVADGALMDGQTVSYLAQDTLNNPKQREWGHGTFSVSGNSVARTTILGGIDTGNDTGVSPVNFSHPPIVSFTALAEDIVSTLSVSGPPTTSNLLSGEAAVVKDTTQATGFGNALYVNDAGAIINLTPKFFLNRNTTFYVSTAGSDSNSGLSAAHPWKTLQHAADVLATNVDANGFAISVQIADGTYAGFTINGAPQGIGSYYQFLGNVTTPTNVIIQDAVFSCVDIEATVFGALQFTGVTFQPVVSGHHGLTLDSDHNLIFLAKCVFDGSSQSGNTDAIGIYNSFCDVEIGFDQSGSAGGGSVTNTWKGSWRGMVSVEAPESLASFVGNPTLSGTPTWSTGAVIAQAVGAIVQGNGVSFTGSATGPRFRIDNNAEVSADGSGNLNFYPGTTAGVVTNGVYDGLIYSQGSTPPNGQVPSYTATLPTTVSSSGSQFQYTFDGSGNLYFCYQANTWAKYTNAAPFDNSGAGASEPIPVIFG